MAKERTGCEERQGSSRKSEYEKVGATAGNHELMRDGCGKAKNDVAAECRAAESIVLFEEKDGHEKEDGGDTVTGKRMASVGGQATGTRQRRNRARCRAWRRYLPRR